MDIGDMLLRSADHQSAEFAEAVAMIDTMREGLLATGGDWTDPQHISIAVSAASIFAGLLFGQMIGLGVARDQDLRRATDAMSANFRQGVRSGKRRAFRAIADMGGGAVN